MTDRRGSALLLSMFLLMALAVLAAGVLVIGTIEGAVAGAMTRSLQARALAEAGARIAFEEWSARALRALPADSVHLAWPLPPVRASTERIDSFLFVIRTEARVPAGNSPPVVGRAGLLVTVLDRGALEAMFPAAVAMDGEARVESGRISGSDACPATAADAPGLFTELAMLGPDALIEGDPALRLETPPPLPDPDPLRPPAIRGLATIEWTTDRATPGPISARGECLPDPANWGSTAPPDPCYGMTPLVHATGDLILDAGEIGGALVVDGDLTLSGPVVIAGILVVRGALVIGPDARVRGAVRAGSLVMTGGDVRLDRCEVARVLDGRPFDRALRPPTRWWVPSH